MSPWRRDSDVGRINAAAGKHPVAVGADTLAVVEKSLWVSELSGGAFDVTFASLGELWRFDPDRAPAVPDRALVARARARIDYRRIALDSRAATVMLAGGEQRIDLGGIAKGYAVDAAARVLRAAELGSFYVQAGGDLYLAGRKPDGEAWRVGIRDPRRPEGSFFAQMRVEDHAFSTAGDYERAFVQGGRRYHHIIDPRTGYPAIASRSVTVWANDGLTADALDDAVFILGPERGLELVEGIDGCGAVVVDADNKVWVSKRLQALVQVLHLPTAGI
jgi:thiamine biosynthesis lipoprotein